MQEKDDLLVDQVVTRFPELNYEDVHHAIEVFRNLLSAHDEHDDVMVSICLTWALYLFAIALFLVMSHSSNDLVSNLSNSIFRQPSSLHIDQYVV